MPLKPRGTYLFKQHTNFARNIDRDAKKEIGARQLRKAAKARRRELKEKAETQ